MPPTPPNPSSQWSDDEERQINQATEVRRRAARLIRQDSRCEENKHASLDNGVCSHCGKKPTVPTEDTPPRKRGLMSLVG